MAPGSDCNPDWLSLAETWGDADLGDIGIDPGSPSLEDLDFLVDAKPQRMGGMRGSFSMNDLQALDSAMGGGYGPSTSAGWPPHHVSMKPSLESVPEGGPAANITGASLLVNPPGMMGMGGGVGGLGGSLEYLSVDALEESLQAGGLADLHAMGAARMSGAHAHGSFLGSAEASGSGGGHGGAGHPSANTAPGYLPPSGGRGMRKSHSALELGGGGLRKSHSALELGAWQQMAAGDMDVADPSGRVRQALAGLDASQKVGNLTHEERLAKILRYRAKRQMRNFKPAVKYQCRKSLADTRPRVRGRFARDNEPGSVMPHETKKALREGAKGEGGANTAEQEGGAGAGVSNPGPGSGGGAAGAPGGYANPPVT
ncbi:hypothetical protein FOA52_015494 [Chlamydomonas sp. UWO 241]|nr:hypothetical protein FOA52_015494 [Chlamydomonas sp. UWO 241]